MRTKYNKMFIVAIITMILVLGLSIEVFAQDDVFIGYIAQLPNTNGDSGQGAFDFFVQKAAEASPDISDYSATPILKLSRREKQAVQNLLNRISSEYDDASGDMFICTFSVGRAPYSLYVLNKGTYQFSYKLYQLFDK